MGITTGPCSINLFLICSLVIPDVTQNDELGTKYFSQFEDLWEQGTKNLALYGKQDSNIVPLIFSKKGIGEKKFFIYIQDIKYCSDRSGLKSAHPSFIFIILSKAPTIPKKIQEEHLF